MIRSLAVCLLSAVAGLGALAAPAAGAALNPAVNLTALSCGSTGNCAAVGTYDDALGDTQGMLLTESRGGWRRAMEAQLPANASFDPFKASNGGALVDVSCPAAGDCVAVGRYTDAGGIDHAVLFTEHRAHWDRGAAVRLPANAVRARRSKSGVVDEVGLAAVNCSSVGNCVAVGNYESNAEVWEAMIVVEHDGRWGRAIAAPLPANAPIAGQKAVLLDITCVSDKACTASGYYIDPSGHQQGLMVSGSGTSWSASPAPTAPSDARHNPNITPSAVSCAAADSCAAVGTYINPLHNSLGLLFSESAGVWQKGTGATLPANAAPSSTVGDQTVVLSSVACTEPGMCAAVGWYFDNDENGQGLIVDEQNGAWQPGSEMKLPANAVTGLEKQSAGLDWVSCPSVGNCLATGVYTDAGYNSQGLLLSEVDGIWQTGVESPLPRNAGDIEYAAADQSACTAAGDCAVIGTYNDAGADILGYTVSESGGRWGAAKEVALPSVNTTEVRLSLSALLAPYGKAAALKRIRQTHGYVFGYAAAEAGTATVSWYASQSGKHVLIGRGRLHARAAGRYSLKLRLTRAGAQLIADASRVRVTAQTSFAHGGHPTIQRASSTFTLR